MNLYISGFDAQLLVLETKFDVGFGVMCIVGDGLSVGVPYGPSTITVGAGVLVGKLSRNGASVATGMGRRVPLLLDI